MMTYKELAERILALPTERQEDNVTILAMDSSEAIPVMDFVETWTEKAPEDMTEENWSQGVDSVMGVLDDGHPYLTISF